MAAVLVADVDERAHLVEGHEVLDAIGEMLGDVAGVVGEGFGGVARLPATFVFEGLGEVPVEESAVRFDVVGEELVDEATVEADALGVGSASSGREDARPADGEAVGLEAHRFHEGDVLLVEVVVVVGYVAGVAVVGLAGSVGEGIPDGGAASVDVDGAFNLIGSGGGAPAKAFGEGVGRGCSAGG